ncbi:hypothetical protein ABBQ38_007244 [Trebouxia sp. C0009 RCD-2024]
MLTYGKTCPRFCLPQQRTKLQPKGPTNLANAAHFARHRGATCNKHARSTVHVATGDAVVATPDESEVFRTNDGVIEAVDEDEAEVDFLGESTSGNLRLVQRVKSEGIVNVLGLEQLDDIVTIPYNTLKKSQQELMRGLKVSPQYPKGLANRAIFCSRTLNLRSIQAIGYDMDYTLVHYDVDAWEGKAFHYMLQNLQSMGCPTEGLHFDATLVTRGLIVDQQLGNLVKADRFGHIKRSMHGTHMMNTGEIREVYGRELVNLKNEGRWCFLNTLFSVSEAVMYMQMVDRYDRGALPNQDFSNSYSSLYKLVQKALFRTHVEGQLKGEIIQDPASYVELDPDMAKSLLDQRAAGKKLMLITNSDYHYTNKMMSYAYNQFLPRGSTWRDLFNMVIVQARKPEFFNSKMSLYEIVTEDGLMRPAMDAKVDDTESRGRLYCGGGAAMVEKALGLNGDEILYVGDHIYTDAALAKINFRWRTCLIVRELELEIDALAQGQVHRNKLKELMNKKDLVGDLFNQLRLRRQRMAGQPTQESAELEETLGQMLMVSDHLDSLIGPMLEQDGQAFNKHWGYLSRAGLNDKSQITRQIEKYADVYTSRVANFLRYTPYMYFRSPSQSLAHDRHFYGLLDENKRW